MADTVPALGTHRRLQGLLALGWPADALAEWLGYPQLGAAAVDVILAQPHVDREAAERVADMYEQLSGTPGLCASTRTTARAAGYAPPLAWDEDTDLDNPDLRPKGIRRGNRALVTDSAVLPGEVVDAAIDDILARHAARRAERRRKAA